MKNIAAVLMLVVGCGSSSTSTSTDTAAGVTLKFEDYLSWCSVAINGGAASTVETQMLTVPQGSVVGLSGDKSSSVFVWGYWVGTDGDTGAGHDTGQVATVTMDKNKIVQACCPFASDPGTPCPAPTP